MRQRITGEGMLSRSPTPGEADFLKDQRKERGYGACVPVRYLGGRLSERPGQSTYPLAFLHGSLADGSGFGALNS